MPKPLTPRQTALINSAMRVAWRAAWAATAGHPDVEVEDVCQELTLVLIRSVRRYKPGTANFNTYVSPYLDHRAREAVWRMKGANWSGRKIPSTSLDTPNDSDREQIESTPDPAPAPEKRVLIRTVADFAAELPKPEREVIVLRYGLDGCPWEPSITQTATALGRSRTDVHRLEHRALDALRDRTR